MYVRYTVFVFVTVTDPVVLVGSGQIWQKLSGSHARQLRAESNYYQNVSPCQITITLGPAVMVDAAPFTGILCYQLLAQAESEPTLAASEIDKDLLRTFPGHSLYETKEGLAMLRRILLAYSVHNPDIGYWYACVMYLSRC